MKYKIKKIQFLMRKIKKIYKKEGFEHSWAINDIVKGFNVSQQTYNIQIKNEQQLQTYVKQKLKQNSNRYLILVMRNLSIIYKSIKQQLSQDQSLSQVKSHALQIPCKLQQTSQSLQIQSQLGINGEQKKYLQIKKQNKNIRLKQLKQLKQEEQKLKNVKEIKDSYEQERNRRQKDYKKMSEIRSLIKQVRSDRYK